MTSSQKIDEWIKEAEERPGSALQILRLIASRLNDLAGRNEELLAENIALQDGSRAEEYRKRIVYLEYQLELLRRRFGLEGDINAGSLPESAQPQPRGLLLYHASGRIIRIQGGLQDFSNPAPLGQISGQEVLTGEIPRLLAVPPEEELLLLFSSGRLSTCRMDQITALETGVSWTWQQASLPDEPRGDELLSAITPLSRLPLSDFFVQVSRRGCVKKTLISLAETILSNHYLGRGALQKADQPYEITLCRKKDRLALVTYEGRLLGLNVDDLTYSIEERIRLEPHDHIMAAFVVEPEQSMLCLTQNGKVIHRDADMLELAKSTTARGQVLISPTRLDQGIRFIGAAAVRETDGVVVLDAGGLLTRHDCRSLIGSGRLPGADPLLSFCTFPAILEESSP
jgi:hypothetical protein